MESIQVRQNTHNFTCSVRAPKKKPFSDYARNQPRNLVKGHARRATNGVCCSRTAFAAKAAQAESTPSTIARLLQQLATLQFYAELRTSRNQRVADGAVCV